jgi:hypothetical protein
LFWEPSNLVASCPRCNYGGGARVAAENTRRTIEDLRALVIEQQQQIAEMAETARPLRASEAPGDLLTGRERMMDVEHAATSPPASSRGVDLHRG